MGLFHRDKPSKDHNPQPTSGTAATHSTPAPSPTRVLIEARAQTFKESREAVSITDEKGAIHYVNPAFCALTGYAAEEALGKTPRILKSGKHDVFFYENLWRHLLAGYAWHGEIVNRRKDGSLYVDEQSITPVCQSDGKVACFVAVRHNVTAKRESELESIWHSEEATVPQKIDLIGSLARTPQELLERTLELLTTLHGFRDWESGLAFIVSHEEHVLRLAATIGDFHPDFLTDEAIIPLGTCLCGRVGLEGRVMVCSNCNRDPLHELRWLGMRPHGHYTIPIRTQDRVLAVVNLYTDVNIEPSSRRIAFLTEVGFRLGAVMQRLLAINHD